MELVELVKWLPQGGAAGAVIVVVWMFLKQQERYASVLQMVTENFTKALDELQEKSDQKHSAMQQQVNDLIRDQIKSNTEMTLAITELRQELRALKTKEN